MSGLCGTRVLVVEDEALIAAMLEDMLVELGAVVVGPASTLARALDLATCELVDAAVLDVNIRSDRVDPVAHMLRARRVPIVFATGYGVSVLSLFGDAPVIEKPYTKQKLGEALILARQSQSSQVSARGIGARTDAGGADASRAMPAPNRAANAGTYLGGK